MEIVKHLGTARDGGTQVVELSNGMEVYIDRRINTSTRNSVYDKYPKDEGAKIIGKYREEVILNEH